MDGHFIFTGRIGYEPEISKLLDKVRNRIRVKGYSIRTEKSYTSWIKRYIYFHGKKHPKEMGKPEIESFLSHLAVIGNVAASTQNQAFNALLFLSGAKASFGPGLRFSFFAILSIARFTYGCKTALALPCTKICHFWIDNI